MTIKHLKQNRPRAIFNLSLFLLTFMLFAFGEGYGQDFELIGKEQPLKVNGGISTNQVFFATSDSISYRDPYSFFVAGNLNFSIYGWSVPLSFSYTNKKTNFTQPFNQYSLHPKYKWVTAHIGYTSMSFSPYTLNGHLFLGAGVDVTPEGPVKVSAMYGRLKKTVEFDTSRNDVIPEYERWGGGLKLDVTANRFDFAKINMGFIAFNAKDKPSSLSGMSDTLVSPQENVVLSTTTNITFKNNISFSGEFATSAMTRDINSELETTNSKHVASHMGSLYTANGSTEYYNALKMNSSYSGERYSIGMGYERIAPNYQTLGAYYFNNDLENITVNGSVSLLQQKITLSGNVGKQRNDLNNNKVSEMQRWVSSVNIAYASGKKLNATISYSNFTSFTNIKSQFDYINAATSYENLDTLDFTQISSTTSGNFSYIIKSDKSVRQNANFNLSYQKASEMQGDVPTNAGMSFYSTNTSYSYAFLPIRFTVMASFNANFNISESMNTKTIGPSLTISKMFFDNKLRNTLGSSYNKTFNEGEASNRSMNFRYIVTYSLLKKHNFNLSSVLLNRKVRINTDPHITTEFTVTLGYAYSF